jgi:hypothetical protein
MGESAPDDQARGEVMKKAAIAAFAIASLVFTTSVASAQLCAVGIVAMAIVASAKDKRELTAKEATTCGLLYGRDQENVKKMKKGKAKTASKAKAKKN